jgi:hypothetical protein
VVQSHSAAPVFKGFCKKNRSHLRPIFDLGFQPGFQYVSADWFARNAYSGWTIDGLVCVARRPPATHGNSHVALSAVEFLDLLPTSTRKTVPRWCYVHGAPQREWTMRTEARSDGLCLEETA